MAYIGVSPSNGVRKKHTYTATASQTSFSGAGAEGITLAYRDSNYVDVYQNGVKLADEDYTATSGTAIVLAQGASADDIVEIIAFDVFSVADTVSKADGGTFDGNVTFAGTLGVTGVLTGTSLDISGDIDVDGTTNLDVVDIDGAVNMATTLTVTGAIIGNSLVVDQMTLNVDTLTTTSHFIIDAVGDITLDADGGDIKLKDGSTIFGELTNNASADGNFDIKCPVSDADIRFKGNDGGATITALSLDMSSQGSATFNHDIKLPDNGIAYFGAGFDLAISSDGANGTIAAPNGTLTLDVAGDITLDAGGQNIIFKDDGTEFGQIYQENNDLKIYSSISNEDLILQGNYGGSIINALTLDMSDAGTAIFNHDVKLVDNGKAIFGAGSDLQIYHDATDSRIENGTGNLRINNNASDLDIIFSVNDGGTQTEVARFDGSVNALVLKDGGGSQANAGKIDIKASGTSYNLIALQTTRTPTGTEFVSFFNSSGTNAGEINHNGSTTVNYSTTSDYRLKENVTYDFDATSRLKQLKPARYNFILDPDVTMDGFLAHEVKNIVPIAVNGDKDEIKKWNKEEIERGFAPDGASEGDNKLDDDGNPIPKYQGIDTSHLVPLLTKALQEQQATIEALTARIVTLENA